MTENIDTSICLTKLTTSDGPLVYRMLQRIPRLENGFYNGAYDLSYDAYKRWLIRQDEISRGINLEKDMVPQTMYWLVVDHIPVGYGKLRHELTDILRETGGNISYSIEPTRRGKGYGTLLLSHLLEEAKKSGQSEAIVTAYNYNFKSIHVAKRNGGINYRITNVKHYFRFQL
ncbi:MAG: GNAT family N-acetyltransferase [bacterium]|nr:GNAT family N-acetyltransferase [bacterium]